MIKLIVPFIIFLIGVYISLNYSSQSFKDGFSSDTGDCPDLLIQQGTELHLLNTKKARIPGVNPVKFDNLEEYIEYLDWQNYHRKGAHKLVLGTPQSPIRGSVGS